jgi:asparagine synthase (glutamine-hydrolysing)
MLLGTLTLRALPTGQIGEPACAFRSGISAAAWRRPWGVASLDNPSGRVTSMPDGSWLAWSGRAWSRDDDAGSPLSAEQFLPQLLDRGAAALNGVDGAFFVAWFDARNRQLGLARDRFGLEPVHYSNGGDTMVFSSMLTGLHELLPASPGIAEDGIRDYFVYGFCPGQPTLLKGARRILPGTAALFRLEDGYVTERVERWHRLCYREQTVTADAAIKEAFASTLDQAVRRQIAGDRPAAMISGGMDSSAAASIMRKYEPGEILSFGFRCAGKAFDESEYARRLAAELGLRHHEVEFSEQDAVDFAAGIEAMDCPFSDAGIEIGTWVVARQASGKADYIVTGDGGDEFWASHPVYAAHRLLRAYESIPVGLPVRRLVKNLLNQVSDSDRKRDLRVVAKRLLPDPNLPRALRHIRWKVYYDSSGLERLLGGMSLPRESPEEIYGSMLRAYEGFNGSPGSLDAMLYNDYYTASTFYLSRLLLFRKHGVEPRHPFFDSDLVNLGTRIPFGKKLEGVERTKRLFRESMRGIVPDLILDRKDKLGHSIPMKNWLRERGMLYDRVSGVVLEELCSRRGLVSRAVAERMLADHVAARENHSHRLWAMYVLEIWLQAHLDAPVDRPEYRVSPVLFDQPVAHC